MLVVAIFRRTTFPLFDCVFQDARLQVQCSYLLNDNEWHVLYIKRRAGDIEAYVDNCRPAEGLCLEAKIIDCGPHPANRDVESFAI